MNPTKRQIMALAACENSEVRSAGYSASELRSAGYSASVLRSAGYSASELRSAGYSASDLTEWDSIPVIANLYSTLLADIKAKKRCHDQKTFGPDQRVENVCGTPMCTAGHLVQMAGDVGWNLRARYDWVGAARLIHKKSRPDVPCQNFGSIPQEHAIAYIEERAAEEDAMREKKGENL